MAIESAINTLVSNGEVVFLTVEAAINGYALMKFQQWWGQN